MPYQAQDRRNSPPLLSHGNRQERAAAADYFLSRTSGIAKVMIKENNKCEKKDSTKPSDRSKRWFIVFSFLCAFLMLDDIFTYDATVAKYGHKEDTQKLLL